MISLVEKINEEARLWEKTKDQKHKENWYKLLEQFTIEKVKLEEAYYD